MSRPTFQVNRIGNGRNITVTCATRRSALQWIGQTICDNGFGMKADVQRFSAKVLDGKAATFGPYTFTLTKSDDGTAS